ncbi:MAG: hypothetical protein COV91_04330 [Candidatus Taylorbacteria bacterium CG11_big_fil_rev_8_21_14_0_20_46_11]|uniref:HEAT repeat domain-containing protein n=1 Tax=Candidatus Taylorbacteria bacterium CG11_big_fil_rev_8_21_14_0_20_46_11 TaxID=1975025 RepID=A0A2H0KCT9_9BACT|nr:MAG: hypothetical protein COV91_04330 [Candidatus Taylorbacteria bacterium CG11_big_fil_rev_8_21_14_0_20_46_11]
MFNLIIMVKKINKNLIIYIFSVGLVIFLFMFLLSINLIGYSVKEKCRIARAKYSGDCAQALISFLDDENNSFQDRNSAIWALGQLGDKRSLPVLKKYYIGYSGERHDRSQSLAQLELKRAIGYMEGNLNITPFFWRFGQGID